MDLVHFEKTYILPNIFSTIDVRFGLCECERLRFEEEVWFCECGPALGSKSLVSILSIGQLENEFEYNITESRIVIGQFNFHKRFRPLVQPKEGMKQPTPDQELMNYFLQFALVKNLKTLYDDLYDEHQNDDRHHGSKWVAF